MIKQTHKKLIFNLKSASFFLISAIALLAAIGSKKSTLTTSDFANEEATFSSYLASSLMTSASAQDGDGGSADGGAACDGAGGACDGDSSVGDSSGLPPVDPLPPLPSTPAPGTNIEIFYGPAPSLPAPTTNNSQTGGSSSGGTRMLQ